jgi:transposase-like protein
VLDVFDHPVIQRCQLHKLRNVTDRLPDAAASTVAKRMRAAYRNPDPLVAQADLEALARELDRSHPGAAGSLREGLAETLTVLRLGVPSTLARTLRSTNTIWVFGLLLRIALLERDLAGRRWLRPDSEFHWSSVRMPSSSRCRARHQARGD